MINYKKNYIESDSLPSVSVVIPTLNCSDYLELYLDSTDNPIMIAKRYTNRVFFNPLKTGVRSLA